MNFGMNLYDWFLTNAQSLILLAIVVMAIYLAYKREITKMIGFLAIAVIVVGLVYNTAGTKDLLLAVYNKVVLGGA